MVQFYESMGTNRNEDYLSDDQFVLKSEEFDMPDGSMEINGKIDDPLEDALLADPDNCGICG